MTIRLDVLSALDYIVVINQGSQTMNGYKAFYKGKSIEVEAETSYKAQQIAAAHFKARKSYEVTVVLCEKNGEQSTHVATF